MQKRQNENHQRIADAGFGYIVAGSSFNIIDCWRRTACRSTGAVCPFYAPGLENMAVLCLFQQKKQKRILDAWKIMETCRNSHPKPASLSLILSIPIALNTHRKIARNYLIEAGPVHRFYQ